MARHDQRHRVVPERRARPRGPPSGRPISAAIQPYGRTSPRGISSALCQTSRSKSVWPRRSRSILDAAVAGQPPADRAQPAASGSWAARYARRPVRARCAASKAASSVARLDRRTRRARSRPRRAARSASRTGRTDRPGRPRPGRSVRASLGRCVHERGQAASRSRSVGGHAVISSRSRRWAASNAVRNRARPRWTWALTVPSGRSRAVASSG